jgi:hypothetical protein
MEHAAIESWECGQFPGLRRLRALCHVSPSSFAFAATSNAVPERQSNSAVSSSVRPCATALLRSAMSISDHSKPSLISPGPTILTPCVARPADSRADAAGRGLVGAAGCGCGGLVSLGMRGKVGLGNFGSRGRVPLRLHPLQPEPSCRIERTSTAQLEKRSGLPPACRINSAGFRTNQVRPKDLPRRRRDD